MSLKYGVGLPQIYMMLGRIRHLHTWTRRVGALGKRH